MSGAVGGVILNPSTVGQGVGTARLEPRLEREPPPLYACHIPRTQIQPRAGRVELGEQRQGAACDDGPRIGHVVFGVPGAQERGAVLRGKEEKPAPAHDRVVGRPAQRPHSHRYLGQLATQHQV